jgi:hypothetical protein
MYRHTRSAAITSGILVIATLLIIATTTTTNAELTAKVYDPEEKADNQADKGHIPQADNICQKAGYDGYINENCGFLN